MVLLESLSDTKIVGNTAIINDDVYCINNSEKWACEFKEQPVENSIFLKLNEFKNGDEELLIINGLHPGNIPNTPTRKGFIENEYIITPIKTIFSLFSLMGIVPISYIGENYGRLIRHVVPRYSARKQISSHGNIEFGFHVDNPDLSLVGEATPVSLCPEYLSLYCLRGGADAITEIVKLNHVIKHLSSNDLKIAREPIFNIQRPASFEDGNPIIKNLPLIVEHNGKYLSRYDSHNVSSDSTQGIKLLEKIKHILSSQNLSVKVKLKPGDFCIFKNQQTLHKRNTFTPRYDGNDRWLLRVFGMSSIPGSANLYNQFLLKS